MSGEIGVPRREKTPPRRPPPPPQHKIINFIARGLEVYGTTYSQVKKITREPRLKVSHTDIVDDFPALQFNESDRRHVVEPQHDSLVISLPMGNCLIKRI